MENSVMALSRENFKYIIVGCVVVIVGFILMSGGGTEDPTQFNEEELFSFRRITLAPFLVMLGYGVVLFGILKRPKKGATIQNANNLEQEVEANEILDDKYDKK
jgi:hypothetical protein|tara:strand:+ start:28 stop:339 length:312 start_codon:yes stop_codon:yes gene_type:complete